MSLLTGLQGQSCAELRLPVNLLLNFFGPGRTIARRMANPTTYQFLSRKRRCREDECGRVLAIITGHFRTEPWCNHATSPRVMQVIIRVEDSGSTIRTMATENLTCAFICN
jgi:hypothetical protein